MPERPVERPDSCRLGLLTDGDPSDEQRAALSTVEQVVETETVDINSIPSSVELDTYDVLWWHRATDGAAASLSSGAAESLERYVERGGGLLLSLYALTTVDELGIDPHAPDSIEETRVPNHEWGHRRAGLLERSRFRDSVVFAGTDDLRVHTQPSEQESAPKLAYEKTVPRHGEILASAVVGEEDRPSRNTVVAWEHGKGRVLGVGQYFVFTEVVPSVRDTVDSLLSGFVAYLDGADAPEISGRPKARTELRRIRESLDDSDRNRPRYHVAPPENWMNDPNGLVQWNGTYHLFYQYNPGGPYHGSIHWGHATSEDLVHWEDQPVALAPDPGGPDEHGCWSGCTVVDDGTPTFVYTGGSNGDQLPCLATATDGELVEWKKHSSNPVIEDPPSDLDILSNEDWNAEFRDHDVWYEDGTWYHLIGSGIEGQGGTALLYTGETLTDWEFEGPILVGDRHEDGGMWECPELLRFDDYDLLQVSNYDKVVYYTGHFDGDTFHRERDGVVDHGNYYAAQTMTDDDGRHLSWGWIREDRGDSAQWDAGWSGVMSVPREVSIDDRGRPVIEPAAELSQLRTHVQSVTDRTLSPGEKNPLAGFSADATEIVLTVELDDADAFELVVRESPDESERTPIRYTDDGELVVDRSESSLSEAANATPQRIEDVPGAEGSLDLRVFIDGSVIEVFVNGRTTLSSRIYPTREDSTGISCVAIGGSATIHDCQVHTMDAAFEMPHTAKSTEVMR